MDSERERQRHAELQRRIKEVRDSWDEVTRLKRGRAMSRTALPPHWADRIRRLHEPGSHLQAELGDSMSFDRAMYLRDHEDDHD